jgi:uncharacterized protein with HEPN domain
MNHDPKAYLFDIKQACEAIKEFTKNMSVVEYSGNTMVKAAVERKFLVIGEAMIRLRREHSETLNKITDQEKIIGFRNVLVHGYEIIDDATVWSAIRDSIPTLQREVEDLLKS